MGKIKNLKQNVGSKLGHINGWHVFAIILAITGLLAAVWIYQTDMAIKGLGQSVVGLQKSNQTQQAAQGNQIVAENEVLLAKWRDIRDANNLGSVLGQKSEAEIKKLLTNGIWDIESQIAKEHDQLVAVLIDGANKRAEAAQTEAQSACFIADVAKAAAEQAQKTAEVGVKTAEIIAQPTKPLRHSLSKQQKEDVRAVLKEWREKIKK